MAKQTFLQGALILIFAGIITRFLGFINRIVLARLLGDEGMGLYMMALPTLFLAMTVTQLGLPVAISKRISEAEALGNQQKVKQILVVSLSITLVSSLFVTLVMVIGSPFIAKTLLTDERTLYPLLAISPIIPITAVSSVIRGYFQGKQNMKPQSYSQIIEQIVRIVFVFMFVYLLLPYGVEFAAAGAMFSVIIGEFVSLLYMVSKFRYNKKFRIRAKFFSFLMKSKNTMKQLFSIALPNTGSRMISSLTNFFEPILVAQSLALAGVTATFATKQYGELTGFVLPLLHLPTFITHSLAIALVPSISEAEAKNNQKLIHYRIHQSIRISFASGAIATVVLTLFAEQILTFMYGTAKASHFIMFMAPFYILLYVQSPLQAALQALDLARNAMWNSLIGAVVKLTVLFFLTSNPNFGINGVAIALNVTVVLITSLHLLTLKKVINYYIPIGVIIKMLLLLSLSFGAGYVLNEIFHPYFRHLFIFLFVLLLLGGIYVMLLFGLKFITKEELKQIPFLKKWVS